MPAAGRAPGAGTGVGRQQPRHVPVVAVIDTPGIYDLPAEVYHGDPVKGGSLSSSGARKLLPPHSPAQFHYELTHRPTPTDDMTFGSAVHKLILGAGAAIREVEADNWRTDKAKAERKAAHEAGLIPLLTKDLAAAQVVADTVRKHPLAAKLLAPGSGHAEQTLVWRDDETGVWCRAMLDWLPTRGRVAVDVKTCNSASPDKVAKSVHDYGYHLQAAHYLDGMRALGLAERPAMVFVFVEKDPPHLVNVVQLNHLALEIGAHYIRQARLVYAECMAKGEWPGYGTDIELIELPAWAQNSYFVETGK